MNPKNTFPSQKKMTAGRMFNFLLPHDRGERGVLKHCFKSLVFTGACLVLFFIVSETYYSLRAVPRFATFSWYIGAKVVRGNTLIAF